MRGGPCARASARRARKNAAKRSTLRTALKAARAAVGSEEESAERSRAESLLDKGAKTSLIPKKRASRLKSRLAKAANRAKAGSGS